LYGHVAGRLGDATRFWMKRAAIGLDETTTNDLIELDFDGKRHAGDGALHREWPIHSTAFEARPDVGGVVHTHPRFSVALAAKGEPFALLGQDSFLFFDGVPLFNSFTHLVESTEDGRKVAACLGRSRAVLLQGHGVVVVGEDVATATVAALMLERACEIQLLAHGGRQASVDEARAIAEARLASARSVFDYHARRLDQA
jgi:ribulose-5-phosphate 4-epimerase/fuculose-1-phosphate aldolase